MLCASGGKGATAPLTPVWGASRPPDPGITADAKGFRIQLALDTEPF